MIISVRLRYLLLAAGTLFLPGLARAQLNFAPGTYQLANGTKGNALLKLVLAEGGRPTVVIGSKAGRERTFRPADLPAFTIDVHRFIRVNDFRFLSGTDAAFPGATWLEALETGPIELTNDDLLLPNRCIPAFNKMAGNTVATTAMSRLSQ